MKPPKETFCLEFMIDDFLQSRRALSLTPKTIRYYQQCLYPFKAYVGERELSDSLIRDYLISIKDKISNASLVTKASGIRALLHYMEEETGQRIKLRMPKAEVHRKPGLSPAEIKRLFAAAKETWNYNRNQAILYTLLDTGLRAMELLSLQVDSINRQTGAFYIKGKGGKTRVGFLSAPTLSMIKRYVRQMQLTSGPLWVNGYGKPLGYDGLKLIFQRLAVATGIKVTAHTLRRVALTEMLRSGMPLPQLQALSGHSDIRTLANHYLVLTEADLKSAHQAHSPVERYL